MHTELESNKKKLFAFAMRGKWKEVVEMYEQDPRLHRAKIVRTGDTALHIAVSEGNEEVVARMVEIVSSCSEQHHKEALQTRNERDNTALHFAASIGNLRMCELIGGTEPSLVGIRNLNGETPLFSAALHGKKQAFLCLHYLCNTDSASPNYSYCRSNCGDTILHSTIAGDYFDLAFQIIHLYKELVNSVNDKGLSPLHLLAAKPSIFKSGSGLGGFEMIIYQCMMVQKLQVAQYEQLPFSTAGKQKTSTHRFPNNYNTCWKLFKAIKNALRVGRSGLKRLQHKKEMHTWSVQIMNELLSHASLYEYDDIGSKPQAFTFAIDIDAYDVPAPYSFDESDNVIRASHSHQQPRKDFDMRKKETPILIAAKNGVIEMVEKILELFPVAIHDMNEEKKNIVLLAVEHRQPHIYQLLLQRNFLKETVFHKVDHMGNSALHLAAKLGDYKPWLVPGAALQMQWEIKWFEFVRDSMPPHFLKQYNKRNKTPIDIFVETHSELVISGGKWLNNTSDSCSTVAALITTVAFAMAATVPGGFNQSNGQPTLEKQSAFDVFAISSLIAPCCSVIAVAMFLSLLISRRQEYDFKSELPRKLILGLTSMFISVVSMLVSFCSGHYFMLKDRLQNLAFPVYAVTCLLVVLFALAQFPLYIDLLWTSFKKVPQRSWIATDSDSLLFPQEGTPVPISK